MKQNLIEDNIIILSKQTLDAILKKEHPSDLIGLYSFYYYTSKWQKTNTIKCATAYVMKGLHWSRKRVVQNKKELKEMGLIEDKISKNEKGQVVSWYIKLNYLWKRETIKNHRVENPPGGFDHRVENPPTNALNANNRNALNADNKKATAIAVADTSAKADIPKIIDLFKAVSPNTYKDWFANTTERKAAQKLAEKMPFEKLEVLITQFLPRLNVLSYTPKDTKAFKPSELLRNLDKIIAKIRELQIKRSDFESKYVKI